MRNIIPIVLSGGNGTRLWPLSRSQRPKQFINLISDHSLFQMTLLRMTGTNRKISNPVIVANYEHRFLVGEQCLEIGVKPLRIVLEPMQKNTAPAIVAGVHAAVESGEDIDPIVIILPSDHTYRDIEEFHRILVLAVEAAEKDKIVIFGITPDKVETGYGYIKESEEYITKDARKILEFSEKPDYNTAERYINEGNYSWNAGIFVSKASVLLDEIKKYSPDVYFPAAEAWCKSNKEYEFVRLNENSYKDCPSISIDYAVIEKSNRCAVLRLDAGWSDVGAWSTVWQNSEQDFLENAARGDVLLKDTTCSYVHADSRMVALLGVSNLVVIETPDAVLVADKSKSQDVKGIVDFLNKDHRIEATQHREVFRPWGSYDSIDNGIRYQVKKISVKPGAKLSLQLHHHRAEHWIVVSGTAKVKIDSVERIVTENESVYIPIGAIHSLENPGKVPLNLIEVQSGAYLGEDDIVRLDDIYGRVDLVPLGHIN